MNPFEELLKELGAYLDTPLKPDPRQSCCLDFGEGVKVQIDLHSDADYLLIGSQVGRIAAGPYRERVFRQAMTVNGTSDKPQGIFAFSEKNDTLVLFQFLSIVSLNGEKLFQFLQLFSSRAKIWNDALHRGEVPNLVEESRSGSGFFGLKP